MNIAVEVKIGRAGEEPGLVRHNRKLFRLLHTSLKNNHNNHTDANSCYKHTHMLANTVCRRSSGTFIPQMAPMETVAYRPLPSTHTHTRMYGMEK